MVVAAAIALGAWAVSSPIGASPDDDFHLQSIWCSGGDAPERCADTADPGTVQVPSQIAFIRCYQFNAQESAGCLDAQPGYASGELTTVDRRTNQTAKLYPPGYYASMSLLVSDATVRSVLVTRFANIVIAIIAIGATLLAIDTARRRALATVWLVTVVPLGAFLVASNNPSAWAIIGVGTFWASFDRWWDGPAGRSAVAAMAAAIFSALLATNARADAAAYIALTVASVMAPQVLRSWRSIIRRSPLRLVFPALVVAWCGIVFLTAGQGDSITSGLGANNTRPNDVDLWFGNLIRLPYVWIGSFGVSPPGGLGWLDTQLPTMAWFPALGSFMALMAAAWRYRDRDVWVKITPLIVTLIVLPMWILARTGVLLPSFVQPRYFLPLLFVLAGFIVIPLFRAEPAALIGRPTTVIVVAMTVANSIALHTNIRRYVTGADLNALDLDRSIEWWWWSGAPTPMTVWAIGTVAFAFAAFSLAQVGTGGEREPRLASSGTRSAPTPESDVPL